jgi:hypothetical protein
VQRTQAGKALRWRKSLRKRKASGLFQSLMNGFDLTFPKE